MKTAVKVFLCVIIVMFLFSGCISEKESPVEKNYIVRHDITIKDFDYFFDKSGGVDRRITDEQMLAIFGWPHRTVITHLGLEFRYYADFGVGSFVVVEGLEHLEVYTRFKETFELPENFGYAKPRLIENKYKMAIREDISEEEISFIEKDATSMELQEKLGAPHDVRIDILEEGFSAFIYDLASGNILIIDYGFYGTVRRAWVEDSQEKIVKELVIEE